MSDDLDLDNINIPGVDDGTSHLTDSVRYHGPPGCGKTTTCAAHIARIIKETDYTIADICWVTYRKSLAFETLERLAKWGIISYDELNEPHRGNTRHVGTMHAIGNRVMPANDAGVVETRDKREFCESIGMKFHDARDFEDGDGELLFDAFGYMVKNCLDPGNEIDVARCESPDLIKFRKQSNKSVTKLWKGWERYKVREGLIDFYEQLRRPIDQGIKCPCPVIVVDEFHDAYPLMAELAERWIDDAEVSIVAGDPDQVVNAYEGASPAFFNNLDIPSQLLDRSWRCKTEHWKQATALLARAPGHTPPDVATEPGGETNYHTSPGAFEKHSSTKAESAHIGRWSVPAMEDGHPATIIHKRGTGSGYGNDPESVLALARTRDQVRGIAAALDTAGILYKTQRKEHDWCEKKRPEFCKDPVPVRRRVFDALATMYHFNPDRCETAYPHQFSFHTEKKYDDEITRFELHPLDAAAVLASTESKYHTRPRTSAKGQRTTSDVIEMLKDREDDDPVTEDEMCAWVKREFFDTYTAGNVNGNDFITSGGLSDRDIVSLEIAINRHAGCGPIRDSEIGVEIMTIHASKGHEAHDVIVYTGITKTIKQKMRDDPDEYANEFRTWYVATTRSSQNLHIINDGFGWLENLPRTPFLGSPDIDAVVSEGRA